MQKTIYVRQSDFDLHVDLKILAQSRGVSESEIIAKAIKQYVDEHRGEVEEYRSQFA